MTPLPSHRRRLIRLGVLAVLAALAGGAVAFVALVPPTNSPYYPQCQLHALTGLHCPGCGLTRSLHALLNGQFLQSLAYNPLWPLVLPLLFTSVVRSLWAWAWGAKPCPRRRPPAWIPWVLGAFILAFAVARNIPAHPFTLLAPHELNAETP